MEERTPHCPVLVLDLGGFSSLGETQKRAVTDRIYDLLESGVRSLIGPLANPWSSVEHWDVGDGFHAVFRAFTAHGAVMVAKRICDAVSAIEKPDVDRLIRLRMVLGHGHVDKTSTPGGGHRWEGAVLTEINRFLDSEELRSRLENDGGPTVLAATKEFVQSWELDEHRHDGATSIDGIWRPFNVKDKHGNPWDGFFFDHPNSTGLDQSDTVDESLGDGRRTPEAANVKPTTPKAEQGGPVSSTSGSGGNGNGAGLKVFFSYNSADKAWAEWVGFVLMEDGHEPILHDWEIAAGQSIPNWMEKRFDEADHILCMISPDYLKNEAAYSISERAAAYWFDPLGKKSFAIPLIVREAQVPRLMRPFSRRSIAELGEAEAREIVRGLLKSPGVPSEKPRYPGAVGQTIPSFPGNLNVSIKSEVSKEEPTEKAERDQQEYLDRVRRRTASLIARSDDLMEFLASKLADCRDLDGKPAAPSVIAGKLLELPFQDTMGLIEEAYREAKDERRNDEIGIVRDIARLIGPAMFRPDIAQQVRVYAEERRPSILPVEIATSTAAEMIVAGSRGTALDRVTWHPDRQAVVSEDRVPIPPEMGDKTTAESMAKEMAIHLVRALVPEARHQHQNLEDRIRIASGRMEQHVKRGRSWCAFFEPGYNDGALARRAAEYLKRDFPEIILLELLDDSTRVSDEDALLWTIRLIEEDAIGDG
jgi:hypothetical protein